MIILAKKNRKSSKKVANGRLDQNESCLPQNMITIGERVEENKNIYISQAAYKMIHRFTQGKTTNESGGMLIGNIIEEFHKTNILISGFVEAKYCDATPTTLKFTHETWEYCHKEIEKKYPGKKIVGWIHTHPNFGITLSEYDTFIHENFFKEEYEVAYVIDPIQNIQGFYFWIGGKIEKCKGFYVFDNNGRKINVNDFEKEKQSPVECHNGNFVNRIVTAVLFFLVLILMVLVIDLNKEVGYLKKQQNSIITSVNQEYENVLKLQEVINSHLKQSGTERIESESVDKESDKGTKP